MRALALALLVGCGGVEGMPCSRANQVQCLPDAGAMAVCECYAGGGHVSCAWHENPCSACEAVSFQLVRCSHGERP